jgi:hypothetical protein
MAMPRKVQDFRAEFIKKNVTPRYSGKLHFGFLLLFGLSGIIVPWFFIEGLKSVELFMIPGAFLVANLVEYWAHRIPMHRSVPGLGVVYRRHTLEHHFYFTHEAMQIEDHRDIKALLFPPELLIFFLIAMAVPLAVGVGAIFGQNSGLIFLSTAMGYYFNYEIFHFMFHLPEDSTLGRWRWLRYVKVTHQTHHDLSKMTRYNFNVTYPIADFVFGTLNRDVSSSTKAN